MSTDTRTLALAQAAHDLRVTARRYARDTDNAADAQAELQAAALRYAAAHADADTGGAA